MKRLSAFSVRARITAAVAVLTALALAGAGFAVYTVELGRLDRTIASEMAQEMGEVRAYQAQGVDPDTGEPFTSADRLLQTFLQRNLPAQNEILFGYLGTGRTRYQGGADVRPLRDSTAFGDAVDELRSTGGGSRSLSVGGDTYALAVLPVRGGSTEAAFAVTHNVTAARAELRNVIGTYAFIAGVALLVIIGAAWFVAGRLLAPVRRLRETTQQISEGDLSGRIEPSGNDDLTELTVTVNEMLDRLQGSFEQQRHLLDDAGHELRTPLTVLRGHLELLDVHDPDDVSSTRALLVDEIDRMSRLVDELLLLAKSRRPDFVVARPVDVGVLTVDVLEKCRALAPRRWTLDQRADVTAPVDGQRLTQALLQLAHNAVRHTGPGDEVAVGSRVAHGDLELWVRDTGSGVAPDDRDRIFDRFQRGAGSGGDDGFGLGLSIVSAIADAHGGTVVLDDTVVGATFRVRVPLAVEDPTTTQTDSTTSSTARMGA
ncbi:MAG: HAMP domain-containing sensor histidine kinase [Nocardioidaceae bacterium]|nr:HAMP domain-containing sensor histidine kinase [Nocardioidaceae bacterium]